MTESFYIAPLSSDPTWHLRAELTEIDIKIEALQGERGRLLAKLLALHDRFYITNPKEVET